MPGGEGADVVEGGRGEGGEGEGEGGGEEEEREREVEEMHFVVGLDGGSERVE